MSLTGYYKENGGLMDNNYLTIYNNIFEAIAQCEETNPLLLLEHNDPAKLRRTLEFILLEDDNGKNVIMPKVFPWVLYRGENDLFFECKPSLFRNSEYDEAELIIKELNIIDFELILKKHPYSIFYEKNNLAVHYRALAQHYELPTELVDFTCDIGVAAYFATHKFNRETKKYETILDENRVGCLRQITGPVVFEKENPIKILGLQPFIRPGAQYALAYKVDRAEDLEDKCRKVIFKQNPEANLKISKVFTHLSVNKPFYGINYVSLRYFNAAGAHESGTIGEDHHPETHFDSTDSSSSAWETRQQIRGANKSVYTY